MSVICPWWYATWASDRARARETECGTPRIVTVRPRSRSESEASVDSRAPQPPDHTAWAASRPASPAGKSSTNSCSRPLQGFSPSSVRKFVNRDLRFPPTCFMVTAIEFVSPSRERRSCLESTCAIASSVSRRTSPNLKAKSRITARPSLMRGSYGPTRVPAPWRNTPAKSGTPCLGDPTSPRGPCQRRFAPWPAVARYGACPRHTLTGRRSIDGTVVARPAPGGRDLGPPRACR